MQKLNIIFKAENQENQQIYSHNISDNIRTEWVLRIDQSFTKVGLNFVSINPNVNNDVIDFINDLIADNIFYNLSQIEEVVYIDENLENVINGEDIESITNLNTSGRISCDFNLLSTDGYPSLSKRTNQDNLTED